MSLTYSLSRHLWLLLAAFLLLSPIAALAQQEGAAPPIPPGANAVTAPDDAAMFRALQGELHGRVSIPDRKAATLMQPEGRNWRETRQGTLKLVIGAFVLGMIGVLVLFYLVRGRIRIDAGRSGRTVERFNGFERFGHWLAAGSFIVLGLTGLNLVFGRTLVLPLVGPELFAEMTHWGKVAHNFLSFPFVLGILLMLLLWFRDNLPDRTDGAWIKAGGGLFSKGRHPPARKFNAGQKLIFWSVVLGGGAVAASGYMLMFPFALTDIAGMQLFHLIHALLAAALIAVILAHIYIGSVGMEGAFAAMGSGQVDLNWAKEHHSLWLEEKLGKGRTASPPNMPGRAPAE
jgi:formate dehydrogenase subunit gamma